MKRWGAIVIAICLWLSACAIAEQSSEKTVDLSGDGIVIMRNKEVIEDEKQKQAIDYPTFEGEDQALTDYLFQVITKPFLAMRKLGQMKEDAAYEGDSKDFIRSGYFVSLDFEGLLSVEMTVINRAAGEKTQETLFMYRIIDLKGLRELTIYDLFDASPDAVDKAISKAVYEVGQNDGSIADTILGVEQIPTASSYFVMKDALRCIFAAGKVKMEASVVDIPWDQLGLPKSAFLTGVGMPEDGEAASPTASIEPPITDLELMLETLMVSDWQYGDAPSYIRFMDDGALENPMGGELEFEEYYIEDGQLVLVQADGEESRLAVAKAGQDLRLTFEAGASSGTSLTLHPLNRMEAAEPAPAMNDGVGEKTAQAESEMPSPLMAAPRADFELPPVQTPTPMPVSGSDVPVVELLTRGLWKQMGTDGTTYYQFMEDGKLLTVNVEAYTVVEGYLQSDSLSGEVIPGGDTAFTLNEDGQLVGYVLNRSGEAVQGQEFVTPTPSPEPTPSPTPEPTATPTPTPTPTPAPTPTLSPYEIARQEAISLSPLGDASFERVKTLKVYTGPSEDAYREESWQVTTDDTVGIYGVEDDWVLVSYTIGNGNKGRMGYINNSTLKEADKVAQLGLGAMELTLTKDAAATDDPLNSAGKITTLKKGSNVKLLAFLGSDWAYVETTYKDKLSRLFIPQKSLMSE